LPFVSPFLIGAPLRIARAGIAARVLWLALRRVWHPARALHLAKAFRAERHRMRGGSGSTRYARAGGRVYPGLYTPGWPSLAFDRFVEGELERLDGAGAGGGLRALILAITKRCPLRCTHCCELPALNRGEGLSVPELVRIVRAFQERGIAQAFLSGGEPMQREEAVLAILESALPGTDFWLLSSGWGLTGERARRLGSAGLTGVVISLDHWDAAGHDRFRGRSGSFAWVERAATAVREADLVLCLALCVRPELATAEGLERYGLLAERLGAAFLELLEPRPVGGWADGAPALSPLELECIGAFALGQNFGAGRVRGPLGAHPAGFQRRTRCFGRADRYVYVDTDGVLHPCAFCRRASGSALDARLDEHLAAMRRLPCPAGFEA
jgi:MoaA/NifB/PqqE/SkfB family radical SAM enzyme